MDASRFWFAYSMIGQNASIDKINHALKAPKKDKSKHKNGGFPAVIEINRIMALELLVF